MLAGRGTLFQHLTFCGLGNLGIARPMQARVTPSQSVLLMCAVGMRHGCVRSGVFYEIVCRADPVREGLTELEAWGWMHVFLGLSFAHASRRIPV